MRRIVVWMSTSLDGFFEGPDREIDWHLVDEEFHSHVNAELAEMGGFIDGRITHQLMEAYWPTADQDPTAPAPVKEFAKIWRDMPKWVYSTTLEQAGWNTTIVRELVVDDVLALKAQPGGDLVVGGAELAAAFQAHGLVDSYQLYIHPVVLGRGRPLFRPADGMTPLRLVDTHRFTNGVVGLRYEKVE